MVSEQQRLEALAALERIAERLRVGALDLPSLREDELAAAAPAERRRRLVPLAVDELDDAGYAAAVERGRRSLVERGLLDGEDEQIGELALVTAARLLPSLVLIADRFAGAAERSSLYLFGLGSSGLLEERPLPGGEHRFALRSAEDAAAAVAAFADPGGKAARDGEPYRIGRCDAGDADGRSELERRLSGARTVTRIFVTAGAGEGVVDEDFTVATLDDGVWLVGGYRDPEGREDRIAAREVSAGTLRGLVAGCLG